MSSGFPLEPAEFLDAFLQLARPLKWRPYGTGQWLDAVGTVRSLRPDELVGAQAVDGFLVTVHDLSLPLTPKPMVGDLIEWDGLARKARRVRSSMVRDQVVWWRFEVGA